MGAAFPLLGWALFDPATAKASEAGLATLAFLYAGLPILLKAGSIGLMWRFPLDAERQAALRAAIEVQSVLPDQPVARAIALK